ncbi:hypothetical protein OKW38_004989 [Paraburkholderia sp. MM5496-R1]
MGHMFLVCTLEKACSVVLENEHNEGKYKKVLGYCQLIEGRAGEITQHKDY